MGKKQKNRKGAGMDANGVLMSIPKTLGQLLNPGSARPSVRAQQLVRMYASFPVTKITSSGAGAVGSVIAPSLSLLNNLTSLQGVFDEYRFIEIIYHVRPVGPNAGDLAYYVDDEDAGAPTLASAGNKAEFIMPVHSGNPKSAFALRYRSQNLTDLSYLSTSTQSTSQFSTLKVYGDTANYGVPASTDMVLVEPVALVEFRGVGGK